MFCTCCGEQNQDGAKFCHSCGAPLVGGSDVTQATQPVDAAAQQPAGQSTAQQPTMQMPAPQGITTQMPAAASGAAGSTGPVQGDVAQQASLVRGRARRKMPMMLFVVLIALAAAGAAFAAYYVYAQVWLPSQQTSQKAASKKDDDSAEDDSAEAEDDGEDESAKADEEAKAAQEQATAEAQAQAQAQAEADAQAAAASQFQSCTWSCSDFTVTVPTEWGATTAEPTSVTESNGWTSYMFAYGDGGACVQVGPDSSRNSSNTVLGTSSSGKTVIYSEAAAGFFTRGATISLS